MGLCGELGSLGGYFRDRWMGRVMMGLPMFMISRMVQSWWGYAYYHLISYVKLKTMDQDVRLLREEGFLEPVGRCL